MWPPVTALPLQLEVAMLRISKEDGGNVLHLSGRLTGAWVAELRRVCETEAGFATELALDLSEVQFADREGVTLLRSLAARGIRVHGSSPFIAELLSPVHGSKAR